MSAVDAWNHFSDNETKLLIAVNINEIFWHFYRETDLTQTQTHTHPSASICTSRNSNHIRICTQLNYTYFALCGGLDLFRCLRLCIKIYYLEFFIFSRMTCGVTFHPIKTSKIAIIYLWWKTSTNNRTTRSAPRRKKYVPVSISCSKFT